MKIQFLMGVLLATVACSSPGEKPKASSSPLLSETASRLRLASGNKTIEALTEGAFAESTGDWDKARIIYSRAMQREPSDARSLLAFARTYVAEGRPREAVELLQRQAQGRPDSVAVQRALGEAMLAAGEPLQALSSLRRARALSMTDGATIAALAEALLLTRGNKELVVMLEESGVGDVPEQLLLPAAEVALLEEASDVSVKALLRHLAMEPGDVLAWVDLARCQFLLGQPDLAGQALISALGIDSRHATSLLLLGHVRFMDGDYLRARRCYETARVNGADKADVDALLGRLQQAVSLQEATDPESNGEA
ncbi:MAG: tetratricopeptide (TPR) repeat protein [Pseudohongiellaceae bacterium]|jgi:tetratricopeptide (TPR) repeat protein